MKTSQVQFPVAGSADAGSRRRLLIVTGEPERFHLLAADADIVASEREAICAVAAADSRYRAVIAAVADVDGRERGYRLVQLLRSQLQMTDPIYLFARAPTPSSRAFALQCGATKLLTDDQDLIDDLLLLVGEGCELRTRQR